MPELEFVNKEYLKYDSLRICIFNGVLELNKEDFRIVNTIEKTEYGYNKAVVELQTSELCQEIAKIESQINNYLRKLKLSPITILYGDKIYCKTYFVDNDNEASKIKLVNIWVNSEKKLYPQIWLMV